MVSPSSSLPPKPSHLSLQEFPNPHSFKTTRRSLTRRPEMDFLEINLPKRLWSFSPCYSESSYWRIFKKPDSTPRNNTTPIADERFFCSMRTFLNGQIAHLILTSLGRRIRISIFFLAEG